MSHVLIVEDDPDAARMMKTLAAHEGFSVSLAHSLREARAEARARQPDLVLLDLQLPDGSGLDLFDEPAVAKAEVTLITGHASLETSIQAFRRGAADYLLKPVTPRQLQALLSRVMRPDALDAEYAGLQAEWERSGRFGLLCGRSDAMKRVYRQLSRVAGTAVTVLVAGESGTGKELVARMVHDLSRRRHAPFLAINCGAISPQLIESEIFGHERGSFTGADRQHLGFFERANGGTLFLDEITEMPLELQVKLLRVLEVGTYMRVGSTVVQQADVRVVAATNRSPELAVKEGRLREDLYYRLNVFPIDVPALRSRPGDVEMLCTYFLDEICKRERSSKRFLPEALSRLAIYRWPGNVRELRNVVQRAYVMTEGASIGAEWLPLNEPSRPEASMSEAGVCIPIGTSLAETERQVILATMLHFNNHKERVAAALGVSLKTLYNRMREYSNPPAAAPLPDGVEERDAETRAPRVTLD